MPSEKHYASFFRTRAKREQEKGNFEYSSGFTHVGDAISNLSYGRKPRVYLPEALELLKDLGASKHLSSEELRAVRESAVFLEHQIEKLNELSL